MLMDEVYWFSKLVDHFDKFFKLVDVLVWDVCRHMLINLFLLIVLVLVLLTKLIAEMYVYRAL